MVRDYEPKDLARLKEIHSGAHLDYKMPDLDTPLFWIKKVYESGGTVTGALVLKLCAETMLLVEGTQLQKARAIKELQPAVLHEAWKQGFDSIHAAVPEIGFDEQLIRLGWSKDRSGWHLWSRETR